MASGRSTFQTKRRPCRASVANGTRLSKLPLTSGTGGGRSNAVSNDSSLRSMLPSTLRLPARETVATPARTATRPTGRQNERDPGRTRLSPPPITSAAARVATPNPIAAPATPTLIATDFATAVGASSSGSSSPSWASRRRRSSVAAVPTTVMGSAIGKRPGSRRRPRTS